MIETKFNIPKFANMPHKNNARMLDTPMANIKKFEKTKIKEDEIKEPY